MRLVVNMAYMGNCNITNQSDKLFTVPTVWNAYSTRPELFGATSPYVDHINDQHQLFSSEQFKSRKHNVRPRFRFRVLFPPTIWYMTFEVRRMVHASSVLRRNSTKAVYIDCWRYIIDTDCVTPRLKYIQYPNAEVDFPESTFLNTREWTYLPLSLCFSPGFFASPRNNASAMACLTYS